MAVARGCALGAALLGGQAGYRVPGGPWWAEFGLASFLLLTVCLRIVFPQDSRDKLALWRHLRPTRPPGTEDEQAAHEQAQGEQGMNGRAAGGRGTGRQAANEQAADEQAQGKQRRNRQAAGEQRRDRQAAGEQRRDRQAAGE